MNFVVSISEAGEVTKGLTPKEEGAVYLVFDQSGSLVASAVYEESSDLDSLSDYVSLNQKESIEQLFEDGLDPTLFEELATASGGTISSSIAEVFTLDFGDVEFPDVSTFFETSPISISSNNVERDDDIFEADISPLSGLVPALTISDAADGSVSVAENSDGLETTVTIPTGVEVGDTVTLTITNPDGSTTEQTYTVTLLDTLNGVAAITIPSLTD
ncbi:hypothetical protein, partial [Vibrio sp. Y20_XG_PY13]|uniref:hypothetical protein n=1 Tax=Vibrio sp. Y20_XG_PY13 TaxID=2957761 RepID=UPI0020A39A8D